MRVAENGPDVVPSVAVAGDMVWVGGGFRSTSLYGIRSTGEVVTTSLAAEGGAGPVAREGDVLAFVTESCTIYSVDATTGQPRWTKYLADPLVSHPAVASNVIYLVAPTDPSATAIVLFAFDAHTGQEHWRANVGADAIGEPVVAGDGIYVTTEDGRLMRFDRAGHAIWGINVSATSAPVVMGSSIFVAARRRTSSGTGEAILRIEQPEEGGPPVLNSSWQVSTHTPSVGRDYGQGGVGQGSPRFRLARARLGTDSTPSLWAWQGARPVLAADKRVLAVLGGQLVAMDASDGHKLWATSQPSAPPAVRENQVFVVTRQGMLEIRDIVSGDLSESIPLGSSSSFPPVLDGDRILVSTDDGRVLSIALSGTQGGAPDAGGPSRPLR